MAISQCHLKMEDITISYKIKFIEKDINYELQNKVIIKANSDKF